MEEEEVKNSPDGEEELKEKTGRESSTPEKGTIPSRRQFIKQLGLVVGTSELFKRASGERLKYVKPVIDTFIVSASYAANNASAENVPPSQILLCGPPSACNPCLPVPCRPNNPCNPDQCKPNVDIWQQKG